MFTCYLTTPSYIGELSVVSTKLKQQKIRVRMVLYPLVLKIKHPTKASFTECLDWEYYYDEQPEQKRVFGCEYSLFQGDTAVSYLILRSSAQEDHLAEDRSIPSLY